jgi:hypothetical protein
MARESHFGFVAPGSLPSLWLPIGNTTTVTFPLDGGINTTTTSTASPWYAKKLTVQSVFVATCGATSATLRIFNNPEGGGGGVLYQVTVPAGSGTRSFSIPMGGIGGRGLQEGIGARLLSGVAGLAVAIQFCPE